MDLKEIQELLKFISKSQLTEVEIEEKDFRIRVQRKMPENIIYQASSPQPVSTQPMQMAPPQAAPAHSEAGSEAPATEKTPVKAVSKIQEFKSPIIGTFYRTPSPDKEAFVKVGDSVSNGQVVCIIEAMKLFNEIESDFDGKIVKILIENAQPVEYDQPLFLWEPF